MTNYLSKMNRFWKKGLSMALAAGLLVSVGAGGMTLAADEPLIAAPISAETASAPFLLTEKGEARASVYLGEGAGEIAATALAELTDTVERISGAVLPRAETLPDEDLCIVLATPETSPEIVSLFADDLAWLGDSDGFAVRRAGNRLYILGACEKGVLNGVYDFLEENCGILWTRGDDALGTLYTERATLKAANTDYREQSPFAFRGWNS